MKTTRKITYTAVLLALLIVLQWATKSLGQFVTGSCVNCVLTVAALLVGWQGGLAVAVVSPFVAFLLSIGPKNIAIVPAIAVGNAVLVLVLWLFLNKKFSVLRAVLGVLCAAGAKFLTLYLLVVQVLCRVLTLPEKQAAMFGTMFSWPQLVTALIGAAVAVAVIPLVRRARRAA